MPEGVLAVSAGSPQWRRLKYFLFFALGLMFLFVLWRNERFLVDHSHPDFAYYYPVRWWLIPHVLGGLIAFVAGPFQFSSRLRQRNLPLHRLTGRCYVAGVAISIPTSVYLSLTHSSLAFSFLLLTLAGAWLATTAVAFVAAMKRNIQMHRQWMVRSFAVTTTFATTRVLTAIPAIGGAGEDVSVPAQWCLLVATLVIAEIGLAWRGIFSRGAVPAAARP